MIYVKGVMLNEHRGEAAAKSSGWLCQGWRSSRKASKIELQSFTDLRYSISRNDRPGTDARTLVRLDHYDVCRGSPAVSNTEYDGQSSISP